MHVQVHMLVETNETNILEMTVNVSYPLLSYQEKSPKYKNPDYGRMTPQTTQPKPNLDDVEDFPPMGSTPKTSSRFEIFFVLFICSSIILNE